MEEQIKEVNGKAQNLEIAWKIPVSGVQTNVTLQQDFPLGSPDCFLNRLVPVGLKLTVRCGNMVRMQ